LPRYSQEESNRGWNVQYTKFGKDKKYFVIDSNKLTEYKDDGNWNLNRTFDGTFGAGGVFSTETILLNENKNLENEIKLIHQENMRLKNSLYERLKRSFHKMFTSVRTKILRARFKPNS